MSAERELQIPVGWLDSLSPSVQFIVLSCAVFLFFGIHNFLQEALMSIDGFDFGVMLGFMEVFGVTICSFLEREYIVKERGRVAPMSAYPLLTGCLLASSSLSNISLNYINFPTKVVFRSCKLIPTMLVASVLHKKTFTVVEYCCAFAICAGLVFFAAADWQLAPSFHPIGLVFVGLSVCADAILPNAQEQLFRMGSSRLEVTFYTNIFTLIAMTFSTILSGDFMGLVRLAQRNNTVVLYMTIYTFIAYIAISAHMTVVKRFGGVAAVLVATGRKGMTLILSFLFFPKQFSWFYVFGAFLVLGGILFSSLHRIYSKKQPPEQARPRENNGRIAMPTTSATTTQTRAGKDDEESASPNISKSSDLPPKRDTKSPIPTFIPRKHDHQR